MPNITGSLEAIQTQNLSADTGEGALYLKRVTGGNSSGGSTAGTVTFDASKSNAIYGASETVQPPSLSLLPQIKY